MSAFSTNSRPMLLSVSVARLIGCINPAVFYNCSHGSTKAGMGLSLCHSAPAIVQPSRLAEKSPAIPTKKQFARDEGSPLSSWTSEASFWAKAVGILGSGAEEGGKTGTMAMWGEHENSLICVTSCSLVCSVAARNTQNSIGQCCPFLWQKRSNTQDNMPAMDNNNKYQDNNQEQLRQDNKSKEITPSSHRGKG